MLKALLVFTAIVGGLLAALPTTTPTDAGAPTSAFELALDCNANTAGIQSTCTQLPGAMFDVDVVATNVSAMPFQLGAFGPFVLNPDISRLVARTPGMDLPACDPVGVDCNPNFNQAAMPAPGDWACNPPPPSPDDPATTEAGQDSFITCFNGSITGPVVAPGASIVLWKVHYRVPAAAPSGNVPLTLSEIGIYDESLGELGTCAPIIFYDMACNGATISIANVSMSLDCLPHAMGIQSNCMVSNMGTTRDVRVVVTNHGTMGLLVNIFEIVVQNPYVARLLAPTIDPPGYSNDNPDGAAVAEAVGWACGPPVPEVDQAATTEPGQDSFLSCYNDAGMPFMIAAGASVPIATVHYDIVPGADPGPVQLTLTNTGVWNQAFTELGSCAPVIVVTMPCAAATLTLYCPIDMADVNNDNIVNVADMGITAANNGVLPAPAHLDQNFDGVINVADRGIIASNYGKRPTIHCP